MLDPIKLIISVYTTYVYIITEDRLISIYKFLLLTSYEKLIINWNLIFSFCFSLPIKFTTFIKLLAYIKLLPVIIYVRVAFLIWGKLWLALLGSSVRSQGLEHLPEVRTGSLAQLASVSSPSTSCGRVCHMQSQELGVGMLRIVPGEPGVWSWCRPLFPHSCFLSLLLVAAVVWKIKQSCWASRRREVSPHR